MFQLLFALVLVIWAVFVLGGLLVLFAVPCTIVISTAVVVLSGLYCWYRMFIFLGSFVHGLPLEYITAQANYTIDMTPPFVQVIRLWRTSQRKGFIGSADFYINKSVGFIGETALSSVRYVTKQHKFHVTLITCLIQILLWPLVMIAKGLILARYWLMTLLYWLIYDVNKLISTVVVSCNYFFGTSCRSPSLAALVSTVWTFTIGLPFRIIKPMKQAVESLLNLPYNAFKWVVSFMVPEQTMAKSNREIVLVILRKVPLIGKNALVQNTAARAMTSVNKALNGMTSLKDNVSSYIHCRYHVIKTEFHSYIDGYISLPLDVVILYVKDTLVVKPGGVIKKWIQVIMNIRVSPRAPESLSRLYLLVISLYLYSYQRSLITLLW